jgi:hypothetical protein
LDSVRHRGIILRLTKKIRAGQESIQDKVKL